MTEPTANRAFALALLVEGGLGLAALGIGWLLGHWSAVGMGVTSPSAAEQWRAIGLGAVATVPLLIALAVIDRLPFEPLDRVRQIAADAIGQLFPQPRIWQLAVIAMVAGLGEELLFRGLLQAGLARLLIVPGGTWLAMAAASVVFGAFHWLNTTYAILAALAGAYFGWLLIATDSLWPPIVAHALYDFVALWYLTRSNQMIRLKV